MFVSFNSTFGPLLVVGFLGMPRRAVTYAGYLQGANDWVSVSAFVLGASMLVFIANLIWSQLFARVPAGANPWGSKSIEFQLPSPVPVHDFDRIPTFGPDPYPYGVVGEEAGIGGPAVAPARPVT
jgi:cytochrome c oxidase subunit 1